MLVWLSLACAPRAPAEPAAVEAAVVTLALDPADLTYDEPAGIVRFTPGSRVQSAAYDVYLLDLASLVQALGGRPDAPVEVLVTLGPATVETVTPADPTLPAPAGGFRYTTRAATVVRAVR